MSIPDCILIAKYSLEDFQQPGAGGGIWRRILDMFGEVAKDADPILD
jgi:hypothetical protein